MNTKVFHFNFETFNKKKSISYIIPYSFKGCFDINPDNQSVLMYAHNLLKDVVNLVTLKKYCSPSTFNKLLQLIGKNEKKYFIFKSINFVSHPNLKDIFILYVK